MPHEPLIITTAAKEWEQWQKTGPQKPPELSLQYTIFQDFGQQEDLGRSWGAHPLIPVGCLNSRLHLESGSLIASVLVDQLLYFQS